MRASLAVVAALVGTATAGNPVVSIEAKVSTATGDSTLTADRMLVRVKASYFAHVERCYRDRFGKAPKASGELKLVFGVEPDGKTSGITVASFDKKLDACIANRVKTWRFDRPKDKTNTAIATGFVLELSLAPAKKRKNDRVVMHEEEAARFADLLMGDSSIENESDMSRQRPGATLGDQIADVKEHGVRSGEGTAGVSTGGGPKQVAPPMPRNRVMVASKTALDETTLTPDTVLAKIQSAYMGAIKRCYAMQLKKNPTLSGKLQISFVVNETGRTTRAIASSSDAELDACLKDRMRSWRFAVPNHDGEPTSARFEMGFTLSPE